MPEIPNKNGYTVISSLSSTSPMVAPVSNVLGIVPNTEEGSVSMQTLIFSMTLPMTDLFAGA